MNNSTNVTKISRQQAEPSKAETEPSIGSCDAFPKIQEGTAKVEVFPARVGEEDGDPANLTEYTNSPWLIAAERNRARIQQIKDDIETKRKEDEREAERRLAEHIKEMEAWL